MEIANQPMRVLPNRDSHRKFLDPHKQSAGIKSLDRLGNFLNLCQVLDLYFTGKDTKCSFNTFIDECHDKMLPRIRAGLFGKKPKRWFNDSSSYQLGRELAYHRNGLHQFVACWPAEHACSRILTIVKATEKASVKAMADKLLAEERV